MYSDVIYTCQSSLANNFVFVYIYIYVYGNIVRFLYCILKSDPECPYWGTNRVPILGDKQGALIGGQNVLIGGQTGCPYWGTNRVPLFGDRVPLLGD